MAKILVKNPIVEMDGDEMTRIIWKLVKEKLILPFLDVQLEYYDLGLEHRDATDDQVTRDAAAAIARHGVGVKCATITPSIAQVKEFRLKKAWPSPNGTLRGALDGTVFRKPIICPNIPTAVRSWTKPITIGRHAYGDIYNSREYHVPGARARPSWSSRRPTAASAVRITIHDFAGPGVVMGMHNTEKSIRSLRALLHELRARREASTSGSRPRTRSARPTTPSSRPFSPRRRRRARRSSRPLGISYRYMLIDDAVAQIVKHPGRHPLGLHELRRRRA